MSASARSRTPASRRRKSSPPWRAAGVGVTHIVDILVGADTERVRGRRHDQLVLPRKAAAASLSRAETESSEDVDRDLFDHLRGLRHGLAEARGVPPCIIFTDATPRDLARRRPTSLDAFAGVDGVGERTLPDLGPTFVEHIRAWSARAGLRLPLPPFGVAFAAVPGVATGTGGIT